MANRKNRTASVVVAWLPDGSGFGSRGGLLLLQAASKG